MGIINVINGHHCSGGEPMGIVKAGGAVTEGFSLVLYVNLESHTCIFLPISVFP